MMTSTEKTQPRRDAVFPPEPDTDYEEGNDPGCMIWGLVGFLGILLATAIVLTAAFAGFSQGLDRAQKTATSARLSNILGQCEFLPTDVAAGRLTIIQGRFEDFAQNGQIPDCAQPYIQIATELYQASLVTPASATPMILASATNPVTSTPPPENTTLATQTIPATSSSGYDLAGLLQEARDQMAIADYEEAMRTLDAILAIDPEYERNVVNSLLFNALTSRATTLYRGDGSLAEAIQLTNRAEQYGDVENLAFERLVAQYYLDAQGFLHVNYPAAIQQLNLVRGFAPNYRDTNELIVQQYAGYAQAFLLGGEPCRAVTQLDAALEIIPQPSLQVQRDQAHSQCMGIPTPVPSGTEIAPIGQSGG